MPELPELEAFVIAQREALTAEPVAAVPVAHFATTKTIDPPLASLVGQRFTSIGRRAKRLLFTAEDGNTLQVHLMSAGRLAVNAKRLKTAMLVVQFDSGRELMMSESGHKRRAGVWLLRPDALAAELAHIGPEPLDPAFTTAALAETLAAHPHQLHAFLRDQRAIAGIGRAFANEILWAARLSPYQRSATLSDDELARLHAAITGVLGAAVERLVPLSGFGLTTKADRGYAVHDRLGEPCARCGDVIRHVSFDEHTVFYCAACQTGGRVLADRRLSRLLRE
ncbi:MAG TPA: DNA-formamidopyrimidine glycosylase family protein [Gaiellales bacterium]